MWACNAWLMIAFVLPQHFGNILTWCRRLLATQLHTSHNCTNTIRKVQKSKMTIHFKFQDVPMPAMCHMQMQRPPPVINITSHIQKQHFTHKTRSQSQSSAVGRHAVWERDLGIIDMMIDYLSHHHIARRRRAELSLCSIALRKDTWADHILTHMRILI